MSGLNTDQIKKGDKITVGKWLKKLGHFPVEAGGKPRNAYALCLKKKLVVAMECATEEAETIVNDNGKLTPFKKIGLETEVRFAETVINVFPVDFWKKATNKNLFLGMLDQYKEQSKIDELMEKENGLDDSISE